MVGAEGATAEAKPEGPVSKEMAAEIDEAVNQAMPEQEKETEEKASVEDTPKEGEKDAPKEGEEEPAIQGDVESKESEEEPQGEESPNEPEGEKDTSEAEAQTDELLTRAVRTGISLKDAKVIAAQDADALERQIQLLEKASQPKAGEGTKEADAGEPAVADEDPLMGIPDLNPETYDEKIVAGFQAMKSIIREQGETLNKQNETIKQLSSGSEKTWFNQQVESLNVKNIDPAKKTELNDQFDVLKAGYAAKGQEVEDTAVFQQATKLVLSEEMKAAKDADKSAKLERRAKSQTARPGGHAAKAKGDPLAEVAEEIDKEYFDKR
jgi:hypothetical protein